MNKVVDYFKNRLRERSTWIGIIMVLTASGIPINPALQQAIIFLGMALAGAPEDRIVRKKQEQATETKIKEVVDADRKKSVNDLLDSDK